MSESTQPENAAATTAPLSENILGLADNLSNPEIAEQTLRTSKCDFLYM